MLINAPPFQCVFFLPTCKYFIYFAQNTEIGCRTIYCTIFLLLLLYVRRYFGHAHGTDLSVGVQVMSGKKMYNTRQVLPVVGGTRTQALEDSMAIVAST